MRVVTSTIMSVVVIITCLVSSLKSKCNDSAYEIAPLSPETFQTLIILVFVTLHYLTCKDWTNLINFNTINDNTWLCFTEKHNKYIHNVSSHTIIQVIWAYYFIFFATTICYRQTHWSEVFYSGDNYPVIVLLSLSLNYTEGGLLASAWVSEVRGWVEG
jgi:hypothetical protein